MNFLLIDSVKTSPFTADIIRDIISDSIRLFHYLWCPFRSPWMRWPSGSCCCCSSPWGRRRRWTCRPGSAFSSSSSSCVGAAASWGRWTWGRWPATWPRHTAGTRSTWRHTKGGIEMKTRQEKNHQSAVERWIQLSQIIKDRQSGLIFYLCASLLST